MRSISVIAKDKSGNALGSGECLQFESPVEFCEWIKDDEKHAAEAMKLVNRQVKTDCRNNLARPKSVNSVLLGVLKGMSEEEQRALLSKADLSEGLVEQILEELNG